MSCTVISINVTNRPKSGPSIDRRGDQIGSKPAAPKARIAADGQHGRRRRRNGKNRSLQVVQPAGQVLQTPVHHRLHVFVADLRQNLRSCKATQLDHGPEVQRRRQAEDRHRRRDAVGQRRHPLDEQHARRESRWTSHSTSATVAQPAMPMPAIQPARCRSRSFPRTSRVTTRYPRAANTTAIGMATRIAEPVPESAQSASSRTREEPGDQQADGGRRDVEIASGIPRNPHCLGRHDRRRAAIIPKNKATAPWPGFLVRSTPLESDV